MGRGEITQGVPSPPPSNRKKEKKEKKKTHKTSRVVSWRTRHKFQRTSSCYGRSGGLARETRHNVSPVVSNRKAGR